ncbi:MAG TPA: hypothetical protein VFB06_03960 [Streptosporangiaceae bacterium]|nr:hypothetical protein [Streptosporangiaceae bacterium]
MDRRQLSGDVPAAVVERSRPRDERADVELNVRQRCGGECGARRQHRVPAGQPQRAQGEGQSPGALEQRPSADDARVSVLGPGVRDVSQFLDAHVVTSLLDGAHQHRVK